MSCFLHEDGPPTGDLHSMNSRPCRAYTKPLQRTLTACAPLTAGASGLIEMSRSYKSVGRELGHEPRNVLSLETTVRRMRSGSFAHDFSCFGRSVCRSFFRVAGRSAECSRGRANLLPGHRCPESGD